MKTTVLKKDTTLPWGVEIELTQGRCIYMGAKNVIIGDEDIEIVINEINSITLPKHTIRKILVMVSNSGQG